MDDQPTGSCPTCERREPRTPQLCDVCRSRLRASLFDITSLFAELEERTDELAAPLEHRPYVATVVEKLKLDDGTKLKVTTRVLTKRAADQVAYLLPSGASSSPSRGGPVTGSKERRLPIDTDAVDLTGPVRSAGVAVLDEDAVGHVSVASVLDFWVEDWRAWRGAGERRPSPAVPEIVRWLLDRLDDAMDHSPSIDEFFHAVRRLYGALKAQLGQLDIPDYKRGVPCPNCAALTLVHHDGSDRIECASCPALLSFIEYDTHVRALSADQVQLRRVKVAQIKAVRRLLEAMRSAGWRHDVRRHGDEDGTYVVHRWRRDRAAVEAWMPTTDGYATLGNVWWVADEVNPSLSLSASGEWVETYGISALQRLARAAGLLTPIKQETAA